MSAFTIHPLSPSLMALVIHKTRKWRLRWLSSHKETCSCICKLPLFRPLHSLTICHRENLGSIAMSVKSNIRTLTWYRTINQESNVFCLITFTRSFNIHCTLAFMCWCSCIPLWRPGFPLPWTSRTSFLRKHHPFRSIFCLIARYCSVWLNTFNKDKVYSRSFQVFKCEGASKVDRTQIWGPRNRDWVEMNGRGLFKNIF